MRNLIIILFATVFMFACSQETEEAASTESEATSESMEAASETAEESTESAAAQEMHNPEVEPLPDWDSLPPIEEMAEETKKPSTPEDMKKTGS